MAACPERQRAGARAGVINVVPAASGRPRLPDLDAVDVQQLPFGPIRADVLESAEFTFLYVGEHILHYQPRLFFKHRGMETLLRGRGPRAGGRHGRARFGRRIGCACARVLRSGRAGGGLRRPGPGERATRSARGTRADLQPPPLPRPPLPYDHAQGRRGARKASRGEGEATERPPDREPFPPQPARPGRAAPRHQSRAMARRRARKPARGVRRAMSGNSRTPKVISIV